MAWGEVCRAGGALSHNVSPRVWVCFAWVYAKAIVWLCTCQCLILWQRKQRSPGHSMHALWRPRRHCTSDNAGHIGAKPCCVYVQELTP